MTNSRNTGRSAIINQLPLQGKSVLITRSRDQAEEFAGLLVEQGANVVFIPTIHITAPKSWQSCDDAIDHIDDYDGLIFTSANAVRMFVERLDARGGETAREKLKSKACYVVGSKTGEALANIGASPFNFPGVANGKQLADALLQSSIRGKSLLFPHGNLVTEELAEILRAGGARVDEVTAYETMAPTDADARFIRETIEQGSIDVVTFFSPSSVKNLMTMISPELISSKTIAAIGPSTAAAAREAGLPVHITPPRPTSDDLIDAIVRYLKE